MEINLTCSEWSNLKYSYEKFDYPLNFKEDSYVIEELKKSRIIEINELRNELEIKTYAHVGRVKFGNIQLTINPKIDDLPFLQLLDYTFDIGAINLHSSAIQTFGITGFVELIIYRLLNELKAIVHFGLYKNYIPFKENLNVLRGRVLMDDMLKNPSLVTSSLPCRYYSRSVDHALNQVLVAGSIYASSISNNNYLKNSLLKEVIALKDYVKLVNLNQSLLSKAFNQINRLNNNYLKALYLIRILYGSSGILFEESKQKIPLDGFLLNMNYFFQNLISKFLVESLPDEDITLEQQIPDFFRVLDKYNPNNHNAPLPRPDIRYKDKNGKTIFLDTKYIDLWENKLPSSVLYQLSVYALSIDAEVSKSIILYPALNEKASDTAIEVRNPFNKYKRAIIVVRPINLNTLHILISADNKRANAKFCRDILTWSEY